MGGIAGFLEGLISGDAPLKDFKRFGQYGQDTIAAGRKLTDEGLFGLRGDLKLFDDRLRNPLGDETKSIFNRARGQVSDDSVRRQRGFTASLAERARQSGGTLSPAAIAELEQQTQRDLSETEFQSQFAIDSQQAALTLTETNKLFDRRADIRRTMLGIGEADKDRGLQQWLASLNLRHNRNAAIAATIASTTGGIGSSGPQPSGAGNPGG
jgi:hypothetical protein